MSTKKEYIAHSSNKYGIIQTIKDHSQGVGKMMRQFALSESLKDLYEFCGLIHDIGKYSDYFQEYITGISTNKVKHSIYGSIYALKNNLIEIALPVYGHHAGLPNMKEMIQIIKAELNKEEDIYNAICAKWSNDEDGRIIKCDDSSFRKLSSDVLKQELLVRMLYSSLVDADFLDTEHHFDTDKALFRFPPRLDTEHLLQKIQQKFMQLADKRNNSGVGINMLRNSVRTFAESKANLPQGFFSLTLPTGLGKTLCSMSWALLHAKHHANIKRIIVVLPFISIIDQTAEEYKRIFNDSNNEFVLEHHSNVVYTNDSGEEFNTKLLATENWDYPIIVTTSVQFFESLFANHKSKCRKLHNIQDSIIIFDEIQTLPLQIIEPTLTMLDNLQSLCRCSILFCTATQPDFEKREGFCGLCHIESLVEEPEDLFAQTQRVNYHSLNNYEEISMSELADTVVKNGKSALVILNTKKKTRLFFEEISNLSGFTRYHLSTAMCPAHRKRVIHDVREALNQNIPIIVCSTQLIEAGVDLDFPSVYRELAPLESIIQSAGRCNREGKLKDDSDKSIKGDVYLFALTESGQPSQQYRSWSEFANILYRGNENRLHTHDFYSYYYRKLIEFYGETDKLKITDGRKKLLFQDVSEKYKIIDNKSLSVFVYKYDDESKGLYYKIKNNEFLSREERQKVSQYSVQVYNIYQNNPMINIEPFGVAVWHGDYHKDLGLTLSGDFNFII